jgi:hypothetical protein
MKAALPLNTAIRPTPLNGRNLFRAFTAIICHARIIALAAAFIVSSAQPSTRGSAESIFRAWQRSGWLQY